MFCPQRQTQNDSVTCVWEPTDDLIINKAGVGILTRERKMIDQFHSKDEESLLKKNFYYVETFVTKEVFSQNYTVFGKVETGLVLLEQGSQRMRCESARIPGR